MTKPRKQLFSLSDTSFYHLVSRCVRREFLCITDDKTGQDYEHRRVWVADRIRILSSVFLIEVLSYAVMSNHYHIVVKVDKDTVKPWSDEEVINRWLCIFKGSPLLQKYHQGKLLNDAERDVIKRLAKRYRKRLRNLSWFIKILNKSIARKSTMRTIVPATTI